MALLPSAHTYALPQQKLLGNQSNKFLGRSLASHSHVRSVSVKRAGVHHIRAFFSPTDEPLVKEALKEPVAFLGGVFAGLLRLDLKEDPLREWVARTAEAAGLDKDRDPEQEESQSQADDETPQQIEIE